MHDTFGTRSTFSTASGEALTLYALPALRAAGIADVSRMPVSLRIVLESLLRNCDGLRVTEQHVRQLANWAPRGERTTEIPFVVGRVVMHELAGIPALGDLAAMRSAAARLSRDPRLIAPKVPVTMVVDHTLAVDYNDDADALGKNMKLEVERNLERFRFLKWAMGAFEGLKVIPPGNGILHQVNMEHLARGVLREGSVCYPDTLVGTDSHTVMINGIGVVGWGVGGIDAGAATLRQPIYILTPDVVGVELKGRMREGVTTTDLVLSVTEALRKAGVVGAFVEYFGDGLEHLAVPDRATLSNMVPEYGATIGFFPPDEETCRFLLSTGRTAEEVDTFRRYYQAQQMFGPVAPGAIDYTRVITFDVGSVQPSVAGPKRPQDRITLSEVPSTFNALLHAPVARGGYGRTTPAPGGEPDDGTIFVAAITSCTNTSNPGVMLAAGLLAKNAAARGLTVKPWVKTSLTPGSRAVSAYLERAGLQAPLDQLGFRVVGYGCATCNGMTGPLYDGTEAALARNGSIGVAVLSGNRNFEARIHPALKASFLMSPPLVVAYALAGNIGVNLEHDPLGEDEAGRKVYLKDLWPSAAELAAVLPHAQDAGLYERVYAAPATSEAWQQIPAAAGDLFAWDESSLYIKEPPFFRDFTLQPEGIADIRGARALALLGDTVTTDHISPVTVIMPDSPAGLYLQSLGVSRKDFNTYGSRRINHDVMIRGTFANPRLRNLMVPDREGSVACHQPDGEVMSIYDAAMRYQAQQVPAIVMAGTDYGMGSARDWAAKGTQLLGVKAVIARSYERIHRTNLAALGVIPCQFEEGGSIQSLRIDGGETFDIVGLSEALEPLQRVTLVIHRANGARDSVPLRVRIDTRAEVEYIRNRGVLPYTLRAMLSAAATSPAAELRA
ncbi:MAG: aconitate hydratase AcnA [Proteobacteria bacterium]|nr:aconitate hydratase AcnA [Burkholderiales bacterium]